MGPNDSNKIFLVNDTNSVKAFISKFKTVIIFICKSRGPAEFSLPGQNFSLLYI